MCYMRWWYEHNPGGKERHRKERYARVKASPDRYARMRARLRESNLVRKYGITTRQYDNLLVSQDGRCAICVTDVPGSRAEMFVVDHDHQTGRVRGLLCDACNKALGGFRDDPGLLDLAAVYLRNFLRDDAKPISLSPEPPRAPDA